MSLKMSAGKRTMWQALLVAFPTSISLSLSPIQAELPLTIEAGYARYQHLNILLHLRNEYVTIASLASGTWGNLVREGFSS